MTSVDEYKGKVEAVLIEAEKHLPDGAVREPWNMVEHGEPAEGLMMLAWVISDSRVHVDHHVIEAIRALTEGWVGPADLPADLDDWATGVSAATEQELVLGPDAR